MTATILDEAMLAIIKIHVAHLAISLDGDAPANGARLFLDGRPAFATIAANIARLREWQIPFALRATITPENTAQASETVEFLAGLGAVSVLVRRLRDFTW